MQETITELLERYKNGLEKDYYGVPIHIKPSAGICTAIQARYSELVDESKELFIKQFEEQETVLDFVEKCDGMMVPALVKMCDTLAMDFVELGELEFSGQKIMELSIGESNCFDNYFHACCKMKEKAEQICIDYGDEVQYRELRKESRGRWSSATFGGNAMDAWGNQLDAELMNLAEGIGHSIFNSVGNSLSKAKMERQLKQLYEDEALRTEIIDSFFAGACQLPLILYSYLIVQLELEPFAIDKSMEERANAVKVNLANLHTTDEKADPVLEKLFELNPLDHNLYAWCLVARGDEEGVLQEVGEYLNIDIEAVKLKALVKVSIKRWKETMNPKQDDINKLKQEYTELIKYMGIRDDKEAWKLFDEFAEEFEVKRRTFDGIVFSSYEESVKAEEEKSELEKLMETAGEPADEVDTVYEEKLKELLETIKNNYDTVIKDRYISVVEEKLVDSKLIS